MSDQPSQHPDSQRPDSGYEPPRFLPPYGTEPPVPPVYGQPAYGQNEQFGNQHSQYGQPASPHARQPGPYGQPSYYGVPAYGVQAEPKTLSIASMVCGIASVIMGWLLLPQVAAIVTGHLAVRREPSGRGMSIAGLVLGYLCLLGYGALWLLLIIGLAYAGSVSSTTF